MRPLLDLASGECRFPTGEAEGRHLFCAAPVAHERTSYCAPHYALAYQPGTAITTRTVDRAVRSQREEHWSEIERLPEAA